MESIRIKNKNVFMPVICTNEHILTSEFVNLRWVVPTGVKGELQNLAGTYILKVTSDLKPYSELKESVTNNLFTLSKEQVLNNWMDLSSNDGKIVLNLLNFDHYMKVKQTEDEKLLEERMKAKDINELMQELSDRLKTL